MKKKKKIKSFNNFKQIIIKYKFVLIGIFVVLLLILFLSDILFTKSYMWSTSLIKYVFITFFEAFILSLILILPLLVVIYIFYYYKRNKKNKKWKKLKPQYKGAIIGFLVGFLIFYFNEFIITLVTFFINKRFELPLPLKDHITSLSLTFLLGLFFSLVGFLIGLLKKSHHTLFRIIVIIISILLILVSITFIITPFLTRIT